MGTMNWAKPEPEVDDDHFHLEPICEVCYQVSIH